MPEAPLHLTVLPHTDTQGTPAAVGAGMILNGLIRIKNGYIQKLGGCVAIGTTISGAFANIMLPWTPESLPPMIGIGSTIAVSTGRLEVNLAGASTIITPTGSVPGNWTLALWGDWLLANPKTGTLYYWIPTNPVTGVALPVSGLVTATIATSGNSYISGTGATSLTTNIATGIEIGQSFTLSGITGTGGFAGLDGTWTATAGTSGTTLNFIATTGLGSTTITGGSILGLGVPTKANGVFVAGPQQQAFAWGIFDTTASEQDPLLIGWCDIANLQDWTASATNQAGSFRLSSGSFIVAGTWFGLIGLFWTDIDLWIAQYINFPLVYGFQRVGQNCGLISPQAWATLGTRVAWMGQNDFFVFEGGSVSVIPCPVRDFIFNTLARTGPHPLINPAPLIHADSNSYYNEITWRFSQGVALGCNAYVKWSPGEGQGGTWDVWADPVAGPPTAMWLNCWSDAAASFPPTGIDLAGALLGFEFSGSNVLIDYNGAALDSFFLTGWFYISESGENIFVERVNPDFIFTAMPEGAPSGQVQITFNFADEIPSNQTDYPVRTYGPYTVTPATPFIIVRGRGRVMQIRVDCTTTGTFWRNGKHMARIAVDGSR